MKKLLTFCFIVSLTIILSSCATIKKPPVIQPPPGQVPCPIISNVITHTVTRGETLWHISKMYNVSVPDILHANNLGKSVVLKEGQLLIIPRAATMRPTIPLYNCRKWEYIIIHHSATEEGDESYINFLHKRRGWDGIGYDFVIDNGTRGKQDGEIEITPRWTKQADGAHCHASDMNYKGIGICLVGNFSKERVSEKQLDSLVYVVNVLRKYYRIPVNNILGHGQVPGARTECPGKYFPWGEFRQKLDKCG